MRGWIMGKAWLPQGPTLCALSRTSPRRDTQHALFSLARGWKGSSRTVRRLLTGHLAPVNSGERSRMKNRRESATLQPPALHSSARLPRWTSSPLSRRWTSHPCGQVPRRPSPMTPSSTAPDGRLDDKRAQASLTAPLPRGPAVQSRRSRKIHPPWGRQGHRPER